MTQPQQAPKMLNFRFLRVNPFRGLLVDETTWADAHDYHRNQMRLHLLALHGIGIVQGLEVIANQTPDTNVIVRPGLAIDTEGRMLLLSEAKLVPITPAANLSNVFIVLEFSERVTQTQTVTEGGKPQAARVLEECQVRATVEVTPGALELARIAVEPGAKQLRPANPNKQATVNEINLSGRRMSNITSGGGASAGPTSNRITMTAGILRYGQAGNVEWKRHSEGLRRLLRDTSGYTNLDGNVLEGVNPLDESVMRTCKLLYVTGRSAYRFTPEEEQALKRFLDRGGVIWAEPCRNGLPNGTPDDFSRSTIEMAQRLGRQPTQPRGGHPLLTAYYLFAAVPVGLDPSGVVVEAGRLVIATSDFGCLWEGRGQERSEPPSREMLRAAQEFGTNALFLASGGN